MKQILTLTVAIFAAAAFSVQAADVKVNYDKQCAKCHGADGKGETKLGQKAGARDWSLAKVQADFDDAKAFKAIKEGVKDGDKTKMKPAEGLSDDEIKELVEHVRAFKK